MPIYLYKCSNCGHQLEALQKISDPRLQDCPQCAQATLVKQVTAAAFKLNGTGWYETDFKNSGKAEKSEGKEDKKPAKKNSDSAAKPDVKATDTSAAAS